MLNYFSSFARGKMISALVRLTESMPANDRELGLYFYKISSDDNDKLTLLSD